MVRAFSLVLLLVGYSCIGEWEKVGCGVATFGPFSGLFVIRLMARAQYDNDGCVSHPAC